MSPLKHYQGPILPSADAFTAAPTPPTEFYAEGPAAPEPVQAIDKPDALRDVTVQIEGAVRHDIALTLYAFPNGMYDALLTHKEGVQTAHAEHPEMALMLAFTKLWSLLDRPRCAHCGQLLPEEGQTV